MGLLAPWGDEIHRWLAQLDQRPGGSVTLPAPTPPAGSATTAPPGTAAARAGRDCSSPCSDHRPAPRQAAPEPEPLAGDDQVNVGVVEAVQHVPCPVWAMSPVVGRGHADVTASTAAARRASGVGARTTRTTPAATASGNVTVCRMPRSRGTCSCRGTRAWDSPLPWSA